MYDIELATARVDAAITYARTIILTLLDSDTPRSQPLAIATKTILDDHMPTLQTRMDQLEHTVRRHHHDPSDHQPSQANSRRSQELITLANRYEHHIRYAIHGDLQHTAESARLILLAVPPAQADAVQDLLAETTGRDPQDETARAYHQAAREAARDNALHRDAVANLASDPEAQPDTTLSRSMLQRALDAIDTIDRLIPPREQDDPVEQTPDQPVRAQPPAATTHPPPPGSTTSSDAGYRTTRTPPPWPSCPPSGSTQPTPSESCSTAARLSS